MRAARRFFFAATSFLISDIAALTMFGSATSPSNLDLLPLPSTSQIIFVQSVCLVARWYISASAAVVSRFDPPEFGFSPPAPPGREDALIPRPGWFQALTRSGGNTSGESTRRIEL